MLCTMTVRGSKDFFLILYYGEMASPILFSIPAMWSAAVFVFCLVQILTLKHIMLPNYIDVIMGTMASQITSLTIVYSIVYSGADQRKHQSSASLTFVRGIHRGPVNSPHKGPVTQKMFPFDDVIMIASFHWNLVGCIPSGYVLSNIFFRLLLGLFPKLLANLSGQLVLIIYLLMLRCSPLSLYWLIIYSASFLHMLLVSVVNFFTGNSSFILHQRLFFPACGFA